MEFRAIPRTQNTEMFNNYFYSFIDLRRISRMLSSSGVSLRMDMFFLYFGAKRPNREVFAHGFGVFVHVIRLSPQGYQSFD